MVAVCAGAAPLVAQQASDSAMPVDSTVNQAVALDSVVAADTSGSAPVVVGTDTVWTIRTAMGAFDPATRAALASTRLDSLFSALSGETPVIEARPSSAGTDLVVGGTTVATVTEADALVEGMTASAWADSIAARIGALAVRPAPRTLSELARGMVFTALATLGLLLVLWAIRWIFPRLYALADPETSRLIRPVRIQRLELISAKRIGEVLTGLLKVLRFVVTAGALYFFIPLVLSFFPLTAGISDQLVAWVLGPLRQAWAAFLAYLPNVFRIAVIVAVMYYALRLVHAVFEGIRFGRINIRGFYRDWALPTYQIVRFLLIALAAIVIWPYLPMSGSPGFRGIAAFLGLLLSLGSASAIANMVGGVVLIYMRSFQVGDRVRIADTVGDVIEKGLLVTRVRTPKNVNVTIPNSMVLGNHLTNYSRAARDEGVILHTTITLGYDVPWPKVHEALKSAAVDVDGLLDEPAPFVLQTSLDDFYVSYELNAYTRSPHRMAGIYSDLHRNIQDRCNEAGIEILSPHFRGLRDAHRPQVPDAYIDAAARVPAFRVEQAGDA